MQATTGTDALDDVSWTCTAAGGAICTQESGTGLPDLSEGETPIGGQLTYSITGTPADGTDRATLTIDAQPTGDAGDLVPSNNTVTDRTDLTPDFDGRPTVVEQADGTLVATPATVRGGGVTSTLQWLRCDAAGSQCQALQGRPARATRPRQQIAG